MTERPRMSAKRVLLFTGDGKGKTTAALGMALRACGHGMSVLVVQFVKADAETGEMRAAGGLLPTLKIEQYGLGFLPPDPDKLADHRQAAQRGLERAREAASSGRYQLLILDEVCYAVHRGLLNEEAVCGLVASAPETCSVVLTGRGATPGLMEAADTVSEVRCAKHGMDAGLKAQKGIEY